MKKKSKINIFYEKSKSTGHGHFIRSDRLYRFLKKRGYNTKIYCNKNSNQINNIVRRYEKDSFLVIDYKNYKKINIKLNKKIIKTIVFENIKKKFFFRSINIYPLDIQFKEKSGPNYFQYPLIFYKLKKRKKTKMKKIINILIIQGGTDANDNLNKIISTFLNSKISFNYRMIVKTNKKSLINNKHFKNKKIKIVGPVKNIDTIYKKIDIAVSACGNAAFELGYLGIPTIHVTSERREIERAKSFEKKKLGVLCFPKNNKKIVNEVNKIYYNENYRRFLINKRILFFRKKNLLINLFN